MSNLKNSPVTALLKGILISYCLTLAVFIIYALLITYTNISESFIPVLSLITTALSCIISGFLTAKTAKSRGLLWGVAAGGLYMLIMFTLGYTTIPTYQLNQKFAISLCLALAGGGIGGIIGVNR